MNTLQFMVRGVGILFCCMVLAGCPIEDGGGNTSGTSNMADMGVEAQLDIGADCQCDGDEIVCRGGCPEALVCAALSCTIECEDSDVCPDGFVCTPVVQSDFENEDMTNLMTQYCLEE